MTRHTIRSLCAALATAFALLGFASPALADWRRAESANFIVYSDGTEGDLRAYVQKLETFDRVLRMRFNLPLDEAAARKLPIYLLSNRRALLTVWPAATSDVAGVYFPSSEGIFAVAFRNGEDDYVLHEYTHHFLMQNFSNVHPGWLTEGFAEYFMTARIAREGIDIGGYNESRAMTLMGADWLPLEVLLSKRPAEVTRSADKDTYYPVAWLLTHWFLGDRSRVVQLQAYLADIGAGGDPVEAMTRATGLSMRELRQALERYTRSGMSLMRYPNDGAPAVITVTRLPDSADDLLLLNQRLKVGVPTEQRPATLADVQRAAARHPNDPLSLLALGHAGLHFGDREGGIAALNQLLEIDPNHVEALQFLTWDLITRSREDGADERAMLAQARGYIVRAYEVAPDDYLTLYLIALMRETSPNYPTENDLNAWGMAYAISPQLSSIRLGYGSALMRAGRGDAAIALLTPLANSPHGGGAADAAQALIERARAGQAPPAEVEVEEGAVEEPQTPTDPATPSG